MYCIQSKTILLQMCSQLYNDKCEKSVLTLTLLLKIKVSLIICVLQVVFLSGIRARVHVWKQQSTKLKVCNIKSKLEKINCVLFILFILICWCFFYIFWKCYYRAIYRYLFFQGMDCYILVFNGMWSQFLVTKL
jgi:hypothetical protein